MKLLVISSAPFISYHDKWHGYSPYVQEMKIWSKYADEIQFCIPIWETDRDLLISEISFDMLPVIRLNEFDIKSVTSIFRSFYSIFVNFKIIYKTMKGVDHIHLRCPGNIGLLGCLVQIFFPSKQKTAKYAGNWDPKSRQPWTYKLQKYILSNTFLTRNMQVLVYGEWKNQSKNIKPFFTATYSEAEKENIQKISFKNTIEFIYVGSLVSGKNPMYVLRLIEVLMEKGHKVNLNIYGEGSERSKLENYIKTNNLEKFVVLGGNQNQEIIKSAYQKSHFVILPSKSEGWPKAIAEGMFWGCVPIATEVSCVPFMIDYGNRGILLETNLDKDINKIEELLKNERRFLDKSTSAIEWSQNYTTDVFETAIKKLLTE